VGGRGRGEEELASATLPSSTGGACPSEFSGFRSGGLASWFSHSKHITAQAEVRRARRQGGETYDLLAVLAISS
jgi:hypothetical protein